MECNAQWTPAYEDIAQAMRDAEERYKKIEQINWIVDIAVALCVAAYLIAVLV